MEFSCGDNFPDSTKLLRRAVSYNSSLGSGPGGESRRAISHDRVKASGGPNSTREERARLMPIAASPPVFGSGAFFWIVVIAIPAMLTRTKGQSTHAMRMLLTETAASRFIVES